MDKQNIGTKVGVFFLENNGKKMGVLWYLPF